MANPSVRQLCSFRCTGLNGSNSTFPTAVCLPFPNVSQARPDSIPPLCWVVTGAGVQIRVVPLRVLRLISLRTRHEAVANLRGAQSAHAAADGLCTFHRERTRR